MRQGDKRKVLTQERFNEERGQPTENERPYGLRSQAMHQEDCIFSPWPLQSPFLGKSETKPREAAAGRENRTGKLALGRREGDRLSWSPHSKSERVRSWSIWDWEHIHKHMKQTCMRAPFLVKKHTLGEFSPKDFGCRFYWNAELKLVPLLSNQPQLFFWCIGSSAMFVKEKILDIMATPLCTF